MIISAASRLKADAPAVRQKDMYDLLPKALRKVGLRRNAAMCGNRNDYFVEAFTEGPVLGELGVAAKVEWHMDRKTCVLKYAVKAKSKTQKGEVSFKEATWKDALGEVTKAIEAQKAKAANA